MENLSEIRKLQATLTKISLNQPTFFNLVNLRDKLNLIKEHGKDVNNRTKYILTKKGQMVMNAVV